MNEVVSAYDQPIEFVTGFAGSGKSTDLSKAVSKDTLVLVPTHKAADVLKSKGVENVYTIYATLKLVPTINENFRKGQKMQTLRTVGKTDLSKIKHIVIDEFSMINVDILDKLLEVLPDTTPVTVYGDPYQLPPVSGDAVDPLDYTSDIRELTKQHRANAPEVVETFMRFMNYIKGTGEMNLKMNPNIRKMTDKQWPSEFNPETDRVLAFTNAEVLRLNSLIKSEAISIGSKVVINDIAGEIIDKGSYTRVYPKSIVKGVIETDDKGKIEDEIHKWGTDVYISRYEEMSILMDDGRKFNVFVDTDHYANSKQFEQDVKDAQFNLINKYNLDKDVDLKKWCYNNKGLDGVAERGQAWSQYLNHQSYIFNLRRPYATTVHKSQGSEFSTVFVAQSDIKKAIRNNHYLQYARLMYVALSRATDRAILV